MTQASGSRPALARNLGLTAATSINIANMIGTGVFLKARVMTCNVGSPGLVLLAWIVGGLLAFSGSLIYGELGAMMPEAGGDYIYIREAYGRRWAFLFGWNTFLIGQTAAEAALAVGFAIFLNIVSGGALNQTFFVVYVFDHVVSFGTLQAIAVAALVLATLVNCAHVGFSGRLASWMTGIKIGLVLAIAAAALFLADGHWGHLLQANAGGTCEGVDAAARGGLAGFGAAVLGALWAYDGWNLAAPMAGEVRDPGRVLPRAFLISISTVVSLYLLVNVAYFYVLSPTEVASVAADSSVATEVIGRFVGATSVMFMAAALMLSTAGALQPSVLTGSRFPFAMARDGLFPRALAAVSPRTHVPVRALVAQCVWACLLALSGSFDWLTDCAMFSLWLFYGLAGSAVFVLRRTRPQAERPYRTWGYPVVPLLFLAMTVWVLVNALQTAPVQSMVGIGITALGLPAYAYWSRAEIESG
jgi:APA family basic amino acid/polyamine antiporter